MKISQAFAHAVASGSIAAGSHLLKSSKVTTISLIAAYTLPEMFKVMDNARSAAFLVAYLMYSTGVTFDEAEGFVQSIRSQVDIKPSWKSAMEDGRWIERVPRQMAD